MAGAAAAINSSITVVFRSICVDSPDSAVRASDNCSLRPLRVPSKSLVWSISWRKLRPPSGPAALPAPLMMSVRFCTAPPLTSTAAPVNRFSTVAAAVVSLMPMVSPSSSSAALADAPAGGLTAMKTSPSGVADRSSTVVPFGNRTPSRMRNVATAV